MLRDYIRCFSKKCNKLQDVSDADVVGSFIYGTNDKAIVRKLGCYKPQTIGKLMEIASDHASGEEAVGAIFDDRGNGP